MSQYLNAMRNYANFTGRASRADYWYFVLVYVCISAAAGFADGLIGGLNGSRGGNLGIFATIVTLVHLIPSLSLFVRRLHDTNRSGWWYFAAFTVVGIIPLFIFSVMRGTVGPNDYGADPISSSFGLNMSVSAGANSNLDALRAYQSTDLIKEVERLSALRSAGHLTQSEFEVMKAALFSKAA